MISNTTGFWYSGVQNYLTEARKKNTPASEIVGEVLALDSRVRDELGAKSPEYNAYKAKVGADLKPEVAALREKQEGLVQRVDAVQSEIKEISDVLGKLDSAKGTVKKRSYTRRPKERQAGEEYTAEDAFKDLKWTYNGKAAGALFPDGEATNGQVKKFSKFVLYSDPKNINYLAKKTGLSPATLKNTAWRDASMSEYLVNIGNRRRKVWALRKKDLPKIIKALK